MDCLNNKRACASYRIMVSVKQVEHYKKEIRFMEQILTATGHEWHEALDDIRRNIDMLG